MPFAISKESRNKILVALVAPLLAFSVWAADRFVDQRVESKVGQLDQRLQGIEQKLAAIQQELKDLKYVP